MLRNHLLAAASCLLVIGCATAAQNQALQMSNTTQQAMGDLKSCILDTYQEQKYAPLTKHFPEPNGITRPTLEQLTDESRPTKQEAVLISAYHAETASCQQSALLQMQTVSPEIAQAISESMNRSDFQMAELARRKITWGQYTQQKEHNRIELQKQLSAINQQINASLVASHQAEIQQRQAMEQRAYDRNLQQQLIQSQNLNAMRQQTPIFNMTTCSSYMPGTVNCQSY